MIHTALAPGGALHALTAYNQFCLWGIETDPVTGKTTKIPVNPRTLRKGSSTRPSDWSTAEHCLQQSAATGFGVAFVFTASDPFFFADIDHALTDGSWSPLAQEVCQRLSGVAIETSWSAEGLHLIGKYDGPRPQHACKNTALGLELYTADRFVALTGSGAVGSAGTVATTALLDYIATYLTGTGGSSRGSEDEWLAGVALGVAPGATPPATDEELISRACKSAGAAAAFSGKATFADLWEGRHSGDASSADRALAQHLAFWTGNDCERILRIMQQSALVRDKWDREDYLRRTILSATGSCTRFYTAPAPAAVGGSPAQKYLGPTQQEELFSGCVYVTELHRVFLPSGEMLKPDQFRVRFGGYTFPLDHDGRKTTRNAWEAFTESQLIDFPKVMATCFYPNRPTSALDNQLGRSRVNTYVDLPVPRKKGDPKRFLDHLHRLLPIQQDADILLAYMAACVQYKGVKFHWTPLVQGAPGNGKSLLTSCVAEAIGMPYCHFPKAKDIDNSFNAWMVNKIFIGVEDIYVPESKLEVIEALKPMITERHLEIQYKGVDQVTKEVCANFMLNSNHKDAIRKTENDRRFCVFYTAQQSAEDIIRDGMSDGYFPSMYTWLREEGYAIVSEYLHTYQIPPHLNPAGACDRAPKTSSTAEVLHCNRDHREMALQDAIAEGTYGLANGWVSSIELKRWLKNSNYKLSPIAASEMLARLGYSKHKGLPDGRSSALVMQEGGRPTLYIHNSNPAKGLTVPAEIIAAYIGSQKFE